jgi:imidazolonepropionase
MSSIEPREGPSMVLTGRGRLCMALPHGAATPTTISPWAIALRGGLIEWVGDPAGAPPTDRREDLGSALVTPGLVDAHSHPVFAGDRSEEAAARLAGHTYAAGGILRTASVTRDAADGELADLVERRLREAMAHGTTTIECKSGYGLTLAEELRHLRLLRDVAARLPIRIVATFLGAHAVPPEAASAADYAAHVADEMVPAVAAERLADFVDVFCDRGFFDHDDVRRIAAAAAGHGLGLRLHADQLARTGAAELGAKLGAAAVDHLDQLDGDGVRALAASTTVATVLPAPTLVMRGRHAPARELLDAGARVALASDANAGTFAGFGAMPLVIGLGATLLGMTVQEALAAATVGGADALQVAVGLIRPGRPADLVAWDAEHEGAFALRLGAVGVLRRWIGGSEV